MAVSRRAKELYDAAYGGAAATGWRDTGAVGKAANIARVCAAAGLPEGPDVVEIGCGDGAVANALGKLDFFRALRGFDLSESGIADARARDIPRATFEVVDGDHVPVADDGADLVVMSHIVEHLEHPRILLHEARRIARYVVVEVPLELHARTPRDYVWDDLGHINKYTSTSIRHLLQTCDLEIMGQITTNPDRSVALFHDQSWKRRAVWRVRETGLAVAPSVARATFTYHETLLARRVG